MLYNSFNMQVNPRWTKQELLNAKHADFRRKANDYIKSIKNCEWFIAHPECNDTQKAQFESDKAGYQKKLDDLIKLFPNVEIY